MAMMKNEVVKLGFNPVFRKYNETKKRYRIGYGSAGSGKSTNTAQDYILKLSSTEYIGASLLVIRKVGESNMTSTYTELQSAIIRIFGDQWQYHWKMTTAPLKMENLTTGNEILFGGMNDYKQEEKVKSIKSKHGSITWIWIEEATELLESQVDVLDDRMRGILNNPNLYYQMTLTFNPVSAMHWIKRKYVDEKRDDVFISHSTYLDNRFIDEAYHRRMERRKIEDAEGYRVYGLGEWGELGGLVLSNYSIEDFITGYEKETKLSYTTKFDYMVNAQDFGFNHANCILEVGFYDGNLYVCKELYLHEHDTSEIIEQAEGMFSKKITMYCDSAEPDRIKTFKKHGYRAVPVSKEQNSVKAQIDHLKKRKIYIHPSCTNTIKEIQQWKYKKDKTTGRYIDSPLEVMDDAMACLRYSIERERKGDGFKALSPIGRFRL